jgi:tetratricopeptide (TPR) repeat protein
MPGANLNFGTTTAIRTWRGLVRVVGLGGLLVVLTAARLAAAGAADAFEQANRLYEQGRYADAIEAYRALLAGGTASPAVYFNLGNSFFKSGQVGRAIVHYRLAQEQAPRDPDVRANLQFARNTVQGGNPAQPGHWSRWLSRLTLDEGAAITAAAFWLWLGLLTLGQLRPSVRKFLHGPARLAGSCAVLLITCTGMLWWEQRRGSTAVVTVPEAAVHFGPLDESQTAFTARDGRELTVTDHQGDWVQVTDAARRSGWLKRDQVVLLP